MALVHLTRLHTVYNMRTVPYIAMSYCTYKVVMIAKASELVPLCHCVEATY